MVYASSPGDVSIGWPGAFRGEGRESLAEVVRMLALTGCALDGLAA